VLARRWSSRTELVVAAMRHYHSALSMHDLPDTGTLRGDMLALLRQLSASVSEMAGVLSFLFADYFLGPVRRGDRVPGAQRRLQPRYGIETFISAGCSR
jgi:hypothetical protein